MGKNKEPKDKERKGVDEMGRTVWDKDHFDAIAKNRAKSGSDDEDGKFIPIPVEQRVYLQRRDSKLQITKDLHKFKVVTDQTSKDQRGGYWCNICECLLKDSATYLDHVNGRPHNRRLGMTMKVEKVSAEDVRAKLASLRKGNAPTKPAYTRKTEQEPAAKVEKVEVEEDIETRLARLEEQMRLKKAKKEKKRKKNDDASIGDALPEEPAKKLKLDTREAIECPNEDDAEAEEGDEIGMSAEDIAAMKLMGLPIGFT